MLHWIIATVLLLTGFAGPARADEPAYRFSHGDTRYEFEGSFRTGADAECLLTMLFEFRHLRRFVTHAKEVILENEGEGWQEVTYRYENFFYRARSTFRRTLNRAENRVDYRLIHLEEDGLIRPGIRSISGYYAVSGGGDARTVTFYQTGELGGGMLSGFYFDHARTVAAGFLNAIRDYAERQCPSPDAQP